MNADFIRIAHRKAIWTELQRILLDKYVASDGPPKEQIICEEVPYANKDVTNEALLEVLEAIQQHECDEQLEMRQFEFKRRRPKDEQRTGDNSNSGAGAEQQPAAAVGEQARAPSEVEAQGDASGAPVGEPAAAPASGAGGKQAGKAR